MAMPLVFFPSLVTSALATTLVSGDFGSNVRKKIQNGQLQNVKINTTYIYMGFIFSAIFMLFPDTIGDLIYRKENIGHILYLLSFTGIFHLSSADPPGHNERPWETGNSS